MSKKVDIKEKLDEINKTSKYKYRLVKEYRDNKDKCIEVYCPEHKYTWITRYNSITRGTKCYYCGIDKNKNSRKLNIDTLRDKFNFDIEVIGKYINNKYNNIQCTCKKCKHTWVTCVSKLKSKTCPTCDRNKKIYNRMEILIDKLKIKFPNLDFSNFKPKDEFEKSIIKCLIHNTQYKKSYTNLAYYFKTIEVCKECEKERKEKYYLNKVKSINKYFIFDLIDGNKLNDRVKLKIICENNHTFIKDYYKFLSNPICTKCNKSKPEKEIVTFIKTFYNNTIEENNRNIILNEYSGHYLELDIYLPDIKLAIEFNGKYYHTDNFICNSRKGFNTAKEYHDYKFKKCEDKNIYLIHIDELDWIDNKDHILNNIKSMILELTKQSI